MSDAFARTGYDAWVSSDARTATYDNGKWLRVVAPAVLGGLNRNAYIFLKSPVPRGATVLEGWLYLFGVGSDGTSRAVKVQRLSEKWDEAHVNFNNQPAATGSVTTVTQAQSVDGLEWSFDIGAQLQAIADGATNYGWYLSTTATTEQKFYSLNAADLRPVLWVRWAMPPDAPTELSPSGGSAVSVAKPVLTFNFHDVAGFDAMQACQVQINPTNSFTAPAFDSGTVVTADPELDLSTTAYAGIAAGATAYWRVRVQNEAGVWSDWSDAVHFTRILKASLTIDNPPDVPNNFVNDPTFEVIWSVTGGTQIGWHLVLADDSDPTHPMYDSGRRAGDDNSFTLPYGALGHTVADGAFTLIDTSTVYRLTLRVWDELTRVQTPGDPVHLEAVRTFTFVEDPTPNPVTSLAAAQQPNGLPHVKLTWSRATAPDGYSIERNGGIIEHNIDPADLLVSGTNYSYIDKSAQPSKTHTWKVRPRVAGKLGPSPTVSLKYLTDEVWICHLDTGRLVPIVSTQDEKQQIAYDMPEIGAVYRPVNGRAAIRVVQNSSGGLEGHIVGRLTSRNGSTAGDWEDNLRWVKKHPEERYRLVLGNQNLNVTIGNVVIGPPGGGDPVQRTVSFDFWDQEGI